MGQDHILAQQAGAQVGAAREAHEVAHSRTVQGLTRLDGGDHLREERNEGLPVRLAAGDGYLRALEGYLRREGILDQAQELIGDTRDRDHGDIRRNGQLGGEHLCHR